MQYKKIDLIHILIRSLLIINLIFHFKLSYLEGIIKISYFFMDNHVFSYQALFAMDNRHGLILNQHILMLFNSPFYMFINFIIIKV